MTCCDSEKSEDRTAVGLIYCEAAKRVVELDKVKASFRFLLISVIAAYFTAFNFLDNAAEGSLFLTASETYLVLFFAISLIAFTAVVVIAMFDFIFQELLEASLKTLARIEDSGPAEFVEFGHYRNRGEDLTSFRISILLTLLYAVPSIAFYVAVVLTSDAFFGDRNTFFNSLLANSLCTSREPNATSFELALGHLQCLPGDSFIAFNDATREIVAYGRLVANAFFSYFVAFCLLRSFGRWLKVVGVTAKSLPVLFSYSLLAFSVYYLGIGISFFLAGDIDGLTVFASDYPRSILSIWTNNNP